MTVSECDLCGSTKECIPNRGRTVCGDCSWAELQDQVKWEGIPMIEDGKLVSYPTHDKATGLPFAPRARAWRYRQ